MYILVRQLAEVAIIEMIDRHFPGVWMHPIADPLQDFLYTNLHPAILGYLGSHFSAGFGDQPAHTEIMRELFISAVREMKSAMLAASSLLSCRAFPMHSSLAQTFLGIVLRVALIHSILVVNWLKHLMPLVCSTGFQCFGITWSVCV
ncbi:MAG: hypothetical protein ABL983_24450 [Nitrospira sp.]